MKKIQIITSYGINSEPVIKNRLEPLIKIFLLNKYKVHLISSDSKKVYYFNQNFISTVVSNTFKVRNFFIRIFLEINLSFKLIKCSQKYKSDLVFVTVPSIFLLFLLFKLKKKNIHLDIRDIQWEYIFKNKYLLKILRIIIIKNLKYVKSISCTNKSEFKSLLNYNFDKKKIYIISNGVSKSKFKDLKKIKKNISKIFTISYLGNVGLAQNLKTLIDVARLMPHIKFKIVGDGVDLNWLKKIAKKNKTLNIKFTGRIVWKEVLNIYNQTDILFLQLDPEFKTAIPSKLYEYLSTGKLIIFAGGSDIMMRLKKFDNIVFAEYDNCSSIVKKINNYINSKKFQNISKKNKNTISRYFIREKLIEKFMISVKKNLE